MGEPGSDDYGGRVASLATQMPSDPPATFRLLIDSVKDYAIFMLDPRGMVATWNTGAARIKGYTARQIIGQHFSRFYTPGDIASGKCEMELEVAGREGRFEDEGWRVRRDGTRFWANVIITALRNESGQLVGFAKVTRDLTERRKAEEERTELAKMHAANQLKDQFLATISHELRTPLNAILGWATLLQTADDPASLEKGHATIRRNAEAQMLIIDDMLDMSRITSGKMRIDVRAVDLVEVTRNAIEVVRPAAEARDIQLRLEGLDQSLMLGGDAGRLQQMAWNLLSNAVKFSNRGGSIEVSLHRENSSLTFRVTDTGKGIEPDFIPYVFEPFRQAEVGPARRVGGVGLGLAIVKHIVELHGGGVTASSEGLGKGASFVVTLPIRAVIPLADDDVKAPPPLSEREARDKTARLDGVRVLAVDDEVDARDILQALFRMRGATVRAAGSASEGREALESFKPHVIVSDVGMPGEGGYQFMRSVRALPKHRGGTTPAIALTAYAYAEDHRRALAAGFNYHLAKPVDHEDLVNVVHNLVDVVDAPWRKDSDT